VIKWSVDPVAARRDSPRQSTVAYGPSTRGATSKQTILDILRVRSRVLKCDSALRVSSKTIFSAVRFNSAKWIPKSTLVKFFV